jgi:hypothetical protein
MRSRDDATAREKDKTHRSLTPPPLSGGAPGPGPPDWQGADRPVPRAAQPPTQRPAAVPRKTTEVHHVPASVSLSARGRAGSRGGPHRGLSSRTGMEPALHLHVISSGMPQLTDWFAYNWTPAFSWWLRELARGGSRREMDVRGRHAGVPAAADAAARRSPGRGRGRGDGTGDAGPRNGTASSGPGNEPSLTHGRAAEAAAFVAGGLKSQCPRFQRTPLPPRLGKLPESCRCSACWAPNGS